MTPGVTPAVKRLRSRRPRRSLLVLLSLLVVAGLSVAGGSAANGGKTIERIDVKNIGRLPDGSFVPASESSKPVTAMLQFSGDPVAKKQADALKQG